MSQRIVLAYSGGLDTSVLLKKLILEGYEVIAMTADLGESDATSGAGARQVLDAVREKAMRLGAHDAVMIDVRDEFVEQYAMPALRANAMYQGVYPLSAALSRPLIAASLVKTARAYSASAVAHGCTGKGNDQVRIEVAVRALDPSLVCRAPLREQPMSRPDAVAFAREHGIPITHTIERPYSVDANLWGRSIEAGVLEDPWNEPPEDAYAWTAAPSDRPSGGEAITIDFHAGSASCRGLSGAPLVDFLNAVGGKHGVGRIDLIEDRVVGLKSREIYECPGAITLITAHASLERLVLTRDELRFKSTCDQRYAELIYDGLWPHPLRTALDAFNASFLARMTGSVRMRLHQGNAVVTGLTSPFALYHQQLATYGVGDRFDHQAAGGFIALHGMPIEAHVRAMTHATAVAESANA
jgi:argininosuccinate synthase